MIKIEYIWDVNVITLSALIIGGIWTYWKFGIRRAGLSVKILDISHKKEELDGQNLVSVSTCINNIGERDLNLHYKEFKLKISEYNIDSGKIIDLEKNQNGVLFTDKLHDYGRIRSGVEYFFPYLIKLDKPGNYFIEFCVYVNIYDYHSFPRSVYYKIRYLNKPKTIEWIDRRFYTIE